MPKGMRIVNLEQGMPQVSTALRWLDGELYTSRRMGVTAGEIDPWLRLLWYGREDSYRRAAGAGCAPCAR